MSVQCNIADQTLNLLSEHHGLKVDEKFVLRVIKPEQNFNLKQRRSCKVLWFSPELTLSEIFITLDSLDPKNYSRLFIFITHCSSELIFDKLMKFSSVRPLILQTFSKTENKVKLYYREENLNQFLEFDQQVAATKNKDCFSSILQTFLDERSGKEEELEKLIKKIQFKQISSLVIRFLKSLNVSIRCQEILVLKCSAYGSINHFLAALNAPFENGSFLYNDDQIFLTNVLNINSSSENKSEDSYDDTSFMHSKSALLSAVEGINTEVIDYLIAYWRPLIQHLPFEHRVRISTAAFETDQLDVLCDLLDNADFPFPQGFKLSDEVTHECLRKVVLARINFENAIKDENFENINQFVETKMNLKMAYLINNTTALNRALKFKRYNVFYYLKSLGFQDEEEDEEDDFDIDELNAEEGKNVTRMQKRKKLLMSKESVNPSVALLSKKSLIYNKKTCREQYAKNLAKVTQYFEDIYKACPILIDVVASCNRLEIIFDFESLLTKNICHFEGNSTSFYPNRNCIFVAAKLLDRKHDQIIKGILAHELCHYAMQLVYQNQGNPFYKHKEDMKQKFEEIVKQIDQWSTQDSGFKDDQCNGIISTTFKSYTTEDLNLELIAKFFQILIEFDDNGKKLNYLQSLYRDVFIFWNDSVIPELKAYLLRNLEVIRLNRNLRLLSIISQHQIEILPKCNIEKIIDAKYVIITTNIPKLLLIDIVKQLKNKFGSLIDSNNLFMELRSLYNKEVSFEFKKISSLFQKLKVFIDCTEKIDEWSFKFLNNMKHNVVFVINPNQFERIENILTKRNMERSILVELNYTWNDLTEESQKSLLNTKVNFQNNSNITLMDLITKNKHSDQQTLPNSTNYSAEIHEIRYIIDDHLLNMLLESDSILINSNYDRDNPEHYFNMLYQPRKYIRKSAHKKAMPFENRYSFKDDFEDDSDDSEDMWLSSRQKKSYNTNLLESEFILDVKNKKYVLISDKAGSGKSWVMKNFARILREQYPTRWVTYVDLKHFINVFKAQKADPEFSSFMVEHILKLRHQFEAKIFSKLYIDGKVSILFDGFDEIAPNYANFVVILAHNFQSNGGNQLWIATRDYFEVNLKYKLKIDVVYSLDEMTENDGVEYIAKSWVLMDLLKDKNEPKSREEFNKLIITSPDFKKYKQKAVQIVKKCSISSYHLVGMAQMFKMIADGFKDEEHVSYLQGFKIYVRIIEIMYIRWSEEKGKIRNEASIKSLHNDLNFIEIHQFHAILSLFPELAKILFPVYNRSEWPQEEIIACGILTIINGKFFFLNGTFRDYFAADLIAKSLKRSKIDEKVVEIFVEILSDEKLGVIRMFLNEMISDQSILYKIQLQANRYVEKFYEMTTFANIIIENHEKLADFVLNILKNGSYERVRDISYKNAREIAIYTKDLRIYIRFQDFLFNFLRSVDLKQLIFEHNLLMGVIESSLDKEILIYFVSLIEEKFSLETIRQALMLVTDRKNVFYFLAKCINLSSLKIQCIFEIMEKHLPSTEILELMTYCNEEKQNILQVCIETKNIDNIKIMWTEIEIFFGKQRYHLVFKDFVKQHSNRGSVLYCIASLDEIEVHQTLWELLLKTFNDLEELKEFILQRNYLRNNFVHHLIANCDNVSIIELTFKNLKENLTEIQFKEIVYSKSFLEENLLQTALRNSKDVEIYKFLWKIFYKVCQTDEILMEIIKECNSFGQNTFHIAAISSSADIFNFMIEEIEKFAVNVEIKEILCSLDKEYQNVLGIAMELNRPTEFCEAIWKNLCKYNDSAEILQIINHVDKLDKKLISAILERYTHKNVDITWNEIRKCQKSKRVAFQISEEAILTEHGGSSDDYCIDFGSAEASRSDEKKIDVEAETNQTFKPTKKFKFIWKGKSKLSSYYFEMNDQDLSELCEHFIIEEVKGEILEKLIYRKTKKCIIQNIISNTGSNLLIFAVKNNYHDVIKSLLAYDFDINYEDNQNKNAIDHAWINYNTLKDTRAEKCETTMVNLLNVNSKLPSQKVNFSFDCAPPKVKEFIEKCENLHKAVANNEFNNNGNFFDRNLRYFYDRHNESLLLYALKMCKVEFLKHFSSFLTIRFDEVYHELTRDPRTEFISVHSEFAKPHIILLKSKSEICGKTHQDHKYWDYIDKIYNILEKNEVCSKVLQIIAESKQLKMFFNFEDDKEDANSIKSFESAGSNIIFSGKQIYIPATLAVDAEKLSSEDGNITANTVNEKLCWSVISLLYLEDFKASETKKSISYVRKDFSNLELTVKDIFNIFDKSLFDYFNNLNTKEIIYVLRILQNEDEVIKYERLPEPMQKKIMKSPIIFQGIRVKFIHIIEDNEKILVHLSSLSIRDILLRSIAINIGDSVETENDYEVVERKLIEYDTMEQTSSQVETPNISFLVDEFGAGKTTTLKEMTLNLKQESESSWVSFVNLKNSSEILQNYVDQNDDFDAEFIVKMHQEIIKTKSPLESAVFRHLFLKDKVILLIDDIDKIKPMLSEFYIKVIKWIHENSKNKLWIATCPVLIEKYQTQFKSTLYKFNHDLSLNLYKLIVRFFVEIKNVNEDFYIPDELTAFINTLMVRQNDKNYSISNCGMIRAIVEVYIVNEVDFKEDPVNFYLIFQKVRRNQQIVFNNYLLEESSELFERFSINKVYQVHALKLIFNGKAEIQLDKLAIINNWNREEQKWSTERIIRHGFMSFDGNNFYFIHQCYAEYFVAEYLISYIFSDDYCIRDEEFGKILRIIRFITQNIDDYEIICNFIIGYAKIKADSECEELHETMRDVILENIEDIQEDINASKDSTNLQQFWSWIVASDPELSKTVCRFKYKLL